MIGRFSLSVVVGIAAALWAISLLIGGQPITERFFNPMSFVVSAILGMLFVFDRWAWAWPGISRLVGRPDLRGTWKGEIRSSWKSGTNDVSSPIEAYMRIHQTYSNLSMRQFTLESTSVTITATIAKSEDDVNAVFAIFRNEPKLALRTKSPIHYGGIILHETNALSMDGHYWTDRTTSGELKFWRISTETVSDFSAARQLSQTAK